MIHVNEWYYDTKETENRPPPQMIDKTEKKWYVIKRWEVKMKEDVRRKYE